MFSDGVTTFTADKTFSKRTSIRRHESNFGLGFSQAKTAGINFTGRELTAIFRNREKAVIDDITDFLDGTKGTSAFTFTLPEGDAISVRYIRYTKNYEYDNYYTLTIELKQVYDL